MFDVPLAAKCHERFAVDLPDHGEPWDVGLIVGPSGSGKSTVAGRAFGDVLYRGAEWPADRAVIDCFGDAPVRQVVELLTAVGFSSPPSWVKPYHVLSTGERFRCDLARALAGGWAVGSRQWAVRSEAAAVGNGDSPPTAHCPLPTAHCPLSPGRLRRIHLGRRSQRRTGLLRRHCEGHSTRDDPVPIRRGDVPLRRGRVARSGLGAGHGRGAP